MKTTVILGLIALAIWQTKKQPEQQAELIWPVYDLTNMYAWNIHPNTTPLVRV